MGKVPLSEETKKAITESRAVRSSKTAKEIAKEIKKERNERHAKLVWKVLFPKWKLYD